LAELNLFFIFIGSIGFDLLIGDPKFIIHPVQIIGFYIEKISEFFFHFLETNERILFWGGLFIVLTTVGISYSVGKYLELAFIQTQSNFIIGILIFLGLSSCYASKSLISSVKEISNLIGNKTINQELERLIKEKVQKIVSRDVSFSSLDHLLRSSTESLTENSVDGIFGPLLWTFCGLLLMKYSIFLPGPLSLGFSYKAISTLDSMIGYKYDHYKFLGFFSAKTEDYSTYIPARIVLLTLPLVSSKRNQYLSIVKKSYFNGRKYDSPNSGISEAIFAYTANIKLGGRSKYQELTIEKPIINCKGSECNLEKINLICKLILKLQFLWIIFFSFIFFIS